MRGNPKYKLGDVVLFKGIGDDEPTKKGVIAIVDAYGTFMDSSDASYDIIVHEENILYKHFREDLVIEKVGEVSEDEIWPKREESEED